MRKFLSSLGTILITSSTVSLLTAAAPNNNQETKLENNKNNSEQTNNLEKLNIKKAQSSPDLKQIIDKITIHLSNLRDPGNKYAVLVPDGRLIPNRDFTFWEWTTGVGLYGIMRSYKVTKEEKYLKIIIDWFKGQEGKNIEKNINTMSLMLTLCDLYEITPEQKYLDMIKEWANWLVTKLPRTKENGFQHVVYASINENQLWADTLMMSVLTLARIGKLLNNDSYKEEAKYQFLLHAKYLFSKNKKLWFHGWTFNEENNFSGAYWGRANAWPIIAIPELISILELKENDAIRFFLEEILKNHIESLEKYQDKKTGLWHTLLNDNESYLETSCTAGFAYGIQKSIKANLVDKKYQKVVDLAIKGILDNVTEEGALLNVSGGTPVFNDLEQYKKVIVGDYPYGQSMAILALVEYNSKNK